MATAKEQAARIAELEAKLEKKNTLSYKVSQKGAVSVYGLGRFPTTLYKGQMARLLDAAPQIRDFMQANNGQLVTKES